jgi:glutaredoxin 3
MSVEAKVYSASYCAWCSKAVQFLESEGLKVRIVDITDDQNERHILVERTGQKTVPQIWIGDSYIGGYDRMMKMASTKDLKPIILEEENKLLKAEINRLGRSI